MYLSRVDCYYLPHATLNVNYWHRIYVLTYSIAASYYYEHHRNQMAVHPWWDLSTQHKLLENWKKKLKSLWIFCVFGDKTTGFKWISSLTVLRADICEVSSESIIQVMSKNQTLKRIDQIWRENFFQKRKSVDSPMILLRRKFSFKTFVAKTFTNNNSCQQKILFNKI